MTPAQKIEVLREQKELEDSIADPIMPISMDAVLWAVETMQPVDKYGIYAALGVVTAGRKSNVAGLITRLIKQGDIVENEGVYSVTKKWQDSDRGIELMEPSAENTNPPITEDTVEILGWRVILRVAGTEVRIYNDRFELSGGWRGSPDDLRKVADAVEKVKVSVNG